MNNYKTQGIVIRRDNMGEADRRITLLTLDYGKKVIRAPGARRPKSRFAPATDLFCEIRFVAARGRTFDILTEVQIINSHDGLSRNLARTKQAYWIGEITERMLHDEEPHKKLYYLLSHTLNIIGMQENDKAVDYYIYNFLCRLGYAPVLHKCAATNNHLSIDGGIYFSPPSGGVVCQKTHQNDAPISVDAIKAIRYMNKPWREFSRVQISSQTQKEVHRHLKNFTQYIIQREIKSEGL